MAINRVHLDTFKPNIAHLDSFEFSPKEISTQESYFKTGVGNLGAGARRGGTE